MDSFNNILMKNLITEPYNYISSFSDYLYILNMNDIITIINENTSKTYDIINQSFASIITYNDKPIEIHLDNIQKQLENIIDTNNTNENNNYYIIQNEMILLYILLILFTIIIYFVNKLFNEYLIQNENNIMYNLTMHKLYNILNDIENNPNKITKGLFTQSLSEIHSNNKNIVDKMINNNNYNNKNSYYMLLRVKMKHSINMYNSTTNMNETKNENNNNFHTNNMYMIVNFNYTYNENSDKNNRNITKLILNTINILNSLTKDEYKNTDFIIVAISKSNNINPTEFYNGLNYINYDMFNIKNVILQYNYGFILLLPIKEVYDLFLDVYNDTIFVSSLYKINKNNNETLCDISINK